MTSDKERCCDGKARSGMNAGAGGGVYGLAFLGALYYFIQNAGTFGEGVLGVIKAIFWPAVLIYKLLEFLQL